MSQSSSAAAALSLAAFAAALLAGCAAPAEPAPDGVRLVRYQCEHGETVEVEYRPARHSALLVRGAQALELPQQPSGSGVIYSNGQHTLRGKGSELIVEIARMVPLRCNAL